MNFYLPVGRFYVDCGEPEVNSETRTSWVGVPGGPLRCGPGIQGQEGWQEEDEWGQILTRGAVQGLGVTGLSCPFAPSSHHQNV